MSKYILQKSKLLVSLLTMSALLFVTGALVQTAFAQQKKLIAIIVPSPENPFFKALADASRRRLLDRLNDYNGQTLRELCAGLDMARQSVTQHLGILEAANLVTTVRRGREKLHFINPVPLHEVYERWVRKFEHQRLSLLHDLKKELEGE